MEAIVVPPPDVIRQRIVDCEEELRQLRRLLRLSRTAKAASEARERREAQATHDAEVAHAG